MFSSPADRRAYPPGASVGFEPARDGWPLRRFDWPAGADASGSILFQGGRGDIIEKYLESFVHWHERGWSVTAFDWRGQGGSGRFLDDPSIGHCPDFGIWIDDLAGFVADWQKRTPGPHIVIGHSMGGHLLLRGLAERRIAPDGAIFVAPMLGFETGPLPVGFSAWIVRQTARFRPERSAWKVNERPGAARLARQPFLTHDDARYSDELWWKSEKPELALGPPSLKWLEQAYSSVVRLSAPGAVEHIAIPVLFIGTEGDRLVKPGAIPEFAARLPRATLKMFGPDVAHEILRESDAARDEALALIDAHLDRAKEAA